MRIVLAALAAAALTAAAAFAQAPMSAAPGPCPTELAAFASKTPAPAAASEAAAKASLPIGKAVTAELLDTPKVKYLIRPEQPGGSVSHGGLYALNVTEPGDYRIALGARPWIDVIRDGKTVESNAHGGAAGCAGVVKVVDFPLTAGRYLIQISGSGEAQLGLLVTKKP